MLEKFDLIIVGAGIAGLSAALEASKRRDRSIAILDRFDGTSSNTYFAQGGIAAAARKGDSWKKHAEDTMKAGCGLCDEEVVNLITKSGPAAVKELMALGLEFDGGNTNPELGLEGGHSGKRILHIKGDQTGKEMELFLRKIVAEQKNIHFLRGTFLREIIAGKGIYSGTAMAMGGETELRSDVIVLATGGLAACFEKTTNPETTLGSGVAIAHETGCELEGMEFVQFHPTTLREDAGGNFLVSEAVRGEGGKIVDENGRQIVNPLDTRDRVSIAIYRETSSGKRVFLDAREIKADFAERFPSVYRELMKHKIDPATDLIPIETAAHYTIGGIKTDIGARSSVRGVFAAGECACSGLHGANRLASNSLLEGLVMGKIAGANAVAGNGIGAAQTAQATGNMVTEKDGIETKEALWAMRKVMWKNCGVIRGEAGLRHGLAEIVNLEKTIEVRDTVESAVARGALLVSRKTIEAALNRGESIGTHCRTN